MTRLWRAATLILTATALVVGSASAVFAATGDDGARDSRPGDSVPDRRGNGDVDPLVDVVASQPTNAVVDGVTDRATDRVTDRETDRPSDRVMDRETDRVRRPECDPAQATDRVRDCRDADVEIRPVLARCINYIQTHTDLTLRRDRRWLWNACHRLVWNHNHPM